MDEYCPWATATKELIPWIELKLLEDDLNKFTEAIKTLVANQNPNAEWAQEALEIFKIPAEFEETDDVIELRLSFYIKTFELIRKVRLALGDSYEEKWDRFLIVMHSSPNIIETFKNIEDAYDTHWYFIHRIMKYIHAAIAAPKNPLKYSDYWLPLLKNQHISFSYKMSHSIVRDIIYPLAEFDCDFHLDDESLRFLPVMRNLCNRHKSMLGWSIGFAMERLHEATEYTEDDEATTEDETTEENEVDKAMGLLHMLLVIARDTMGIDRRSISLHNARP